MNKKEEYILMNEVCGNCSKEEQCQRGDWKECPIVEAEIKNRGNTGDCWKVK